MAAEKLPRIGPEQGHESYPEFCRDYGHRALTIINGNQPHAVKRSELLKLAELHLPADTVADSMENFAGDPGVSESLLRLDRHEATKLIREAGLPQIAAKGALLDAIMHSSTPQQKLRLIESFSRAAAMPLSRDFEPTIRGLMRAIGREAPLPPNANLVPYAAGGRKKASDSAPGRMDYDTFTKGLADA